MSSIVITTLACAAAPSAMVALSTLAGAGFIGMGVYKLGEYFVESMADVRAEDLLSDGNLMTVKQKQMKKNHELLSMMEEHMIASFRSKLEELEGEVKEKIGKEIDDLTLEFSVVKKGYDIEKFEGDYEETEFFQQLKFLEDNALKLRQKLECNLINQSQEFYDPFLGRKGIYGSRDEPTVAKNDKVAIDDVSEEKVVFAGEEQDQIRSEMEYFGKLLVELDQECDGKVSKMIVNAESETILQKLEMALLTIKLDYGKTLENVAHTRTFKELLGNILIQIEGIPENEALKIEINKVSEYKVISGDIFNSLQKKSGMLIQDYLKIQMEKMEHQLISKQIYSELKSLGYSVVKSPEGDFEKKLMNGEIVYIETDDPEYKVMIKMNESGEYTFRFVRVVGTQSEKESISTYQKDKDKEKAQEWCSNFDKFTEKLKVVGIDCGIGLRNEPDACDVMYVIDETFKNKKSTKKSSDTENKDLKRI
ncbi:hypothetical protein KAJ27_19130 [bacterium]|nr:hypothetical protein [bacterium]